MATIQLSQIRTDRIENLREAISGDEVKELMDSIKNHGLLYPIIVSGPDDENQYDLVCGHRRYEAARRLNFRRINAAVRKIKNEDITALQLIENIQRKELTPLEEASAYEKLVKEHSVSQADIARKIGKTRAYVSNVMKVLEAHPAVQQALDEGEINVTDVRDIRKLDLGEQENIINDSRNEAGLPPRKPKKPDPIKGKSKKGKGKKKPVVVDEEHAKEKAEAKKVMRKAVKEKVSDKKKGMKKEPGKKLTERLDAMKNEYAEMFAKRHDMESGLNENQKTFFVDVLQFLFEQKALIVK